MNYEEIVKEIKAKKYRQIYFLSGEEPFFIDRITDLIENEVLPEEHMAFNRTVIYGNEASMGAIIDMARRYPFDATHQVVVIREAQNIKDFELLSAYLDRPQPSTILLFAYKNKKADKRKSVFKKISTSPTAVYFESNKLYENKVPDWIIAYCKSKDYSISIKAAGILAESLGTDLSRIAHEIDKLSLLLPEKGEIKEALVEQHTGISKDFNTFELQNALIKKDYLKANRIVNYFEANPKNSPLVQTISTLFRYFLNLLTYHYQKKSVSGNQEMAAILGVNIYFLKDFQEGAKTYGAVKCAKIISLLREYDLKSKGVGNAGIPDGELLKELVFKIMH